jgi:hypothetical protein
MELSLLTVQNYKFNTLTGLEVRRLCTFHTVHYNILLKETNQHNAQINIYSFTSLQLHVSVSVDHLQGACSYTVHQLKQYVLTSKI